MDIKDKVAVITGGASGLGEATVRTLVEKGARCAIFDLNEEKGDALARDLGDSVIFQKVNVADEDSAKAGIAATMDAFGAIHICCNYAGLGNAIKTVGKDGPFPLDKFKFVIEVNLIGTFNVLRLAAGQMANNDPDAGGERGVIINTASIAAYDGQMGQAAYASSKAGVVGLTLPVARDLAKLGIRVMAIAPGIFDTPMMKGMTDEVREPLIRMVQNPKRFGDPEEYAALALHIITNGYLNGEVIRIDGALRMEPR